MPGIEKVMNGLEHCAVRHRCNSECPYSDIIQDQNEGMDSCITQLSKDALELLKSQQAEIERMKGEGKSPTWKKGKAFCGNCGGCIENKNRFSTYYVQSIRFCKWCGAPVDWSNE